MNQLNNIACSLNTFCSADTLSVLPYYATTMIVVFVIVSFYGLLRKRLRDFVSYGASAILLYIVMYLTHFTI